MHKVDPLKYTDPEGYKKLQKLKSMWPDGIRNYTPRLYHVYLILDVLYGSDPEKHNLRRSIITDNVVYFEANSSPNWWNVKNIIHSLFMWISKNR